MWIIIGLLAFCLSSIQPLRVRAQLKDMVLKRSNPDEKSENLQNKRRKII